MPGLCTPAANGRTNPQPRAFNRRTSVDSLEQATSKGRSPRSAVEVRKRRAQALPRPRSPRSLWHNNGHCAGETHEGHHLARCARIARSAHRMARHNDRPDPVRDLISMGLRSDSYAKSSSTPRSVRVKCRNGMVAHVENANWSAVDAHQLRSRRRAINRTQKRLSRARALIQTCASEGGRQYTTMSRAIKVG